MLYPEVSKQVVDGFFAVHRELGSGLLESCYHNALFYELRRQGLGVEYEKPLSVSYRGQVVGEFYADLVVENRVIIEVKAVTEFSRFMDAQLLNYLRISGLRLGFLVNFQGIKAEFKRFIV
jgi:GxxExxY protein